MGKMYDALQKAEKGRLLEQKPEPVNALSGNSVLDDKIVTYFQPGSIVAEQFRKLRTYLTVIENKPKTILLTSSYSGEGKSLIAINLAITIAVELNSYAMLVDCDLRNPTLSKWFGMTESRGLSDYLLGDDDLPGLMVKTQIDKLTLLTGGSTQDNPVELIASKRMVTLVNELKSRYNDRYIILDSSPVLATTEPNVLNNVVDGIIFVIRAGETPREWVKQAVKVLGKEKIIGVVLNDMNFKSPAIHSRYFGTNRYYYGYLKEKRPRTFFEKMGSMFKKK